MKKLRKLSRKKDSRRSLVKNLATSLIFYEKITTTLAKAKMTISYTERIFREILKIKTAKKEEALSLRRNLIIKLSDKKAIEKIFKDIVNRLGARKSGFCKIVRLPNRRLGDNAEMVKIILLLEAPKIEKVEDKK